MVALTAYTGLEAECGQHKYSFLHCSIAGPFRTPAVLCAAIYTIASMTADRQADRQLLSAQHCVALTRHRKTSCAVFDGSDLLYSTRLFR